MYVLFCSSSHKDSFFFLFHVCVSVCHVNTASVQAKGILDPLEQELQAIGSYLSWVLGSKLGSSGIAANALDL